MARTHGRAPRGERCRAPVPHGHWKTTTFVGALTLGGMTAPWVIDGAMDGAMDGEMFLHRVRTQLVPILRPGDIVVMDNLGSHKSQTVRREIRAVGAHLLFLPP
ncbi:MAG: transposase, partial [Pseudomonadota bacterium]